MSTLWYRFLRRIGRAPSCTECGAGYAPIIFIGGGPHFCQACADYFSRNGFFPSQRSEFTGPPPYPLYWDPLVSAYRLPPEADGVTR